MARALDALIADVYSNVRRDLVCRCHLTALHQLEILLTLVVLCLRFQPLIEQIEESESRRDSLWFCLERLSLLHLHFHILEKLLFQIVTNDGVELFW